MGTVFEAEHVHTGERVALKLISAMLAGPEAVERFKLEARTFAAIKSPHLARIIDAGTASELEDAPFFAMELLEGEDLAARVARAGPQLPDDVVSWIDQASRALAKAHERGIVHRDLKPANLFLAQVDGVEVLKVLDFGVAKIADASLQTASGAILGTPRYMAPEQARGEGATVTPAADLWSIAMIVFTSLTGAPYFRAEGVAGTLSQVLFDEIVPPSARGCDLGPAFDAWFLASTARDPASRMQSVLEQAHGLRAAIAGKEARLRAPVPSTALSAETLSVGDDAGHVLTDPSASAARSASLDVAPAPPRRRVAPLAAAGLLLVAAVGASAWVISPGAPGAVRGPASSTSSTSSPTSGPVAPSAVSVTSPSVMVEVATAPPAASSQGVRARPSPSAAARPSGKPVDAPRPPPPPTTPAPIDPFASQKLSAGSPRTFSRARRAHARREAAFVPHVR